MAVERIGRAVLELVTDSAKFFADIDKAKAEGRKLGQSFDDVSRQLRSFGGGATSAGQSLTAGITLPITAAVGGLIALTVNSAKAGDAIAKNAREAGLSARSYQELTFAVGQVAKVTDEELTKAFGKITQVIGDAAAGNEKAEQSLRKLGFTQLEIAAGTITTEEAFNRLNTKMQTAGTSAEALAIAGDLVGDRIGPKLAGALRESGGEIDALREKFRDAGLVLTNDMLKASEKFGDQMDLIGRMFAALGHQIGTVVLPVISEEFIPFLQEKAIPAIRALVEWVGKGVKMFLDLPRPIQLGAVGLVALAAAAGPLLIIIGQMASGVAALTAAFGAKGIATVALTSQTGLLRTVMVALTTPITVNTVATGALATAKGVLAGATATVTGAMGALRVAILAMPWAAATAAAGALAGALVYLYASSKNAALAAETQGAKQDVINKAIANGADHVAKMADQTKAYAAAIEFNTAKQAVFAAQFDKSVAAQLRGIEGKRALIAADLEMGRITQENANALLLALRTEEQALTIRKNRVTISESVAQQEEAIKQKIEATGYTMQQLLAELKKNEIGFKAWAQEVNLGSEVVAFLEARLKRNTTATKEAESAAEKHAKALEKQRDALQKLGIVTETQVNEALAEFETLVMHAAAAGVPMDRILAALAPKLAELKKQADGSGLSIRGLNVALDETTRAAGRVLQVPDVKFVQGVPEAIGQLVKFDGAAAVASISARNLTDSYHHFGLSTREELRKTAQDAVANFNFLVASGKATPAQIKVAFEQMRDAVRASTGEIPSFWEKDVAPRIKSVVADIGAAISDGFADMILQAKGFGDGFKGIWEDIKRSVLNVFQDILSAFINNLLKNMLASLIGQRGAFAGGFAGLFGGGGGGVLGNSGGLLGSLFGIGGGTGLPGTVVGPLAIPGGGAAGGAGFLASGLGSILGGAGIGAGGFGLGMLGQQLFGGAGAGSSLFGAGTGAAQGALLGSMLFPGIGTVLGGLIGGGAGLIGGLLGIGSNDTRKQREAFAQDLGVQDTTQLWEMLREKLPPELAESLRHRALNVIGKKDTAANQQWMQDVLDALDKYAAKEMEVAQVAKVAAAEKVAAHRQVLEGLEATMQSLDSEYSRLWASIEDEMPEEITEDNPLGMGVIEAQTRARMAEIDKERAHVQQQIEEVTLAMEESMKSVQDAVIELARSLRTDVGGAIEDIGRRSVRIPVSFEIEDPEDLSVSSRAGIVPMAGGGLGRVTSPTLFLAGERGPEDFAFSGANRSFAAGGAAPPAPVFDGTVILHVPPGELTRAMTDGTPLVVRAINNNHRGTRNQLFGRGKALGTI